MRKPSWVTRIEKRARRKRFALLASLLRDIDPPIRILDVGGSSEFWRNIDYRPLGEMHVTLLNLFPQENLLPNFCSRVGDACCLEENDPEEFDIVVSNSVIGHVGSFENQKRMASEIRRVGRRYYVQTPNHYFPVDWRTLIPFFHFLPLWCRASLIYCLPITQFGRIRPYAEALRWAGRVRNLTLHELRMLFPEAIIVRERFLGFTKSFMVYSGFPAATVPPGESASLRPVTSVHDRADQI